MKKILYILFTLSIICCITSCENNTVSQNSKDNSKTVSDAKQIALESCEWPDNEYTQGILKPESGTVSEGWIDSDEGYLYILLSDITKENFQNYTESLKKEGFSLIEDISKKNEDQYTSIDIVLKKDDTYLSFSYTNDTLAMYIKK